jgi:hypothetical protein
MPKFIVGDLWESKADIIVVTTNGYVNANGELVMGRGAALQAKNRYPRLPKLLAAHLNNKPKINSCLVYGFEDVWFRNGVGIGAFQVKYSWKDKADLALIGYSVVQLNLWLNDTYQSEDVRVAMNYPGIGNGGLNKKRVVQIVESLDTRVEIYSFD